MEPRDGGDLWTIELREHDRVLRSDCYADEDEAIRAWRTR